MKAWLGFKRHRALAGFALLLLAGTHGALFLLARGMAMNGAAGQGREELDLLQASYLPGKSAIRGGTGPKPAAGTPGTRLLKELEASRISREDFLAARRELFRDWIRRDLRGAMDELLGPESGPRYAGLAIELSAELDAEICRQPYAVWDWIASRHYGSEGPAVFDIWSKALMADGQVGVLLECLPRDPHFLDSRLLEGLCDHATPAQLPQVRALMDLKGMLGEGGTNYYTDRMVDEVGANPAAFFKMETSPEFRASFTEEWMSTELAYLPLADRMAAVAALPDDVRADAVMLLAYAPCTQGPRAVADMINALEAGGLLGDSSSEDAGRIADGAVAAWTVSGKDAEYTDLADSFHALQSIRSEPLRHEALGRLAWRSEDPGGAGAESVLLESIGTLPVGPDRDAFLAGAATTNPWLTPETRERLLSAITDPDAAAAARGKAQADPEEGAEE